jgi:hypothetical protein
MSSWALLSAHAVAGVPSAVAGMSPGPGPYADGVDDWLGRLTPAERREWDDLVDHCRRELVGMIDKSAFVMSLVPDPDEVDVKFAIELGLSIMLDKPIVAVALPGATIPAQLRRVAARVITADIDTEAGQRQVALALTQMAPGSAAPPPAKGRARPGGKRKRRRR